MSTAARSRGTTTRRARATQRGHLVVARARRRRLAWQAGGAAAVFLMVGAALWSPLFDVRNIAVSGARHTGSEEISRAADIDEGENLLFVSVADVEDAVERLPWVKSADVNRRLFGTLRVRVTEREPAMKLRTSEGAWIVDEHGKVLQTASGGKTRLPVFKSAGPTAYEPGERVGALSIRRALLAFGTFTDEVQAEVKSASADDVENIRFTLRGGIEVRYGSLGRMRDKAEVLAAVLGQIRTRAASIDYIDVRVPASPALGTTSPETVTDDTLVTEVEGDTEMVPEPLPSP
ncbi:MAG: FtsQ-type POTRA domain-containing protein [Actinomycetota bacterium]|nr:FtsQ-type POTRA domain-containing protein [Actinomycetota bacterium]